MVWHLSCSAYEHVVNRSSKNSSTSQIIMQQSDDYLQLDNVSNMQMGDILIGNTDYNERYSKIVQPFQDINYQNSADNGVENICHCFYSCSSIETLGSGIVHSGQYKPYREVCWDTAADLLSQSISCSSWFHSPITEQLSSANGRTSVTTLRQEFENNGMCGPFRGNITNGIYTFDKAGETCSNETSELIPTINSRVESAARNTVANTKRVLNTQVDSSNNIWDLIRDEICILSEICPILVVRPLDNSEIIWKRENTILSSKTSTETLAEQNITCGFSDGNGHHITSTYAPIQAKGFEKSFQEAGDQCLPNISSHCIYDVPTKDSNQHSSVAVHHNSMHKRREFSSGLMLVLKEIKAELMNEKCAHILYTDVLKDLRVHCQSLYVLISNIKRSTRGILTALCSSKGENTSNISFSLFMEDVHSKLQFLHVIERQSLTRLQNLELECTCNVIAICKPKIVAGMQIYINESCAD